MIKFECGKLVIVDEERFNKYVNFKINHCNQLVLTEKIRDYITLLMKFYTYKKAVNYIRLLYWTSNCKSIKEFENQLEVLFDSFVA